MNIKRIIWRSAVSSIVLFIAILLLIWIMESLPNIIDIYANWVVSQHPIAYLTLLPILFIGFVLLAIMIQLFPGDKNDSKI